MYICFLINIFSIETNHFHPKSIYKIVGTIAGKIKITQTNWYIFNLGAGYAREEFQNNIAKNRFTLIAGLTFIL